MEPLTNAIECWDDDTDLHGEEFHFRKTSIATTVSVRSDTISSRFLSKSDMGLNSSADESPRAYTAEDFREELQRQQKRVEVPCHEVAWGVASDDEGFDDLVLPEGPLDLKSVKSQPYEAPMGDEESSTIEEPYTEDEFRAKLEKQKSRVKWAYEESAHGADHDDFFIGIDIGDEDVFESTKETSNHNIKLKSNASNTRIPKPHGILKSKQSNLEAVSECGGPVSSYRRPHSGTSHIPTPSKAPSSHSAAPSTPSKRGLVSKQSREALRSEPTTTSAQLLKVKRSMPAMRSPFLPAGNAASQSHHVSIKSFRHSRDSSVDQLPVSRPPSRGRKDLAPEALAKEAAAKRTLTRPARRQNFGNGSELEIFDDLPTSANTENKFVKAPIGRGAPKSLRSKFGQSHIPLISEQTKAQTALPTPVNPARYGQTPHFARDTNASRIAREQRIGTTNVRSDNTPMVPVASTNGKAQVAARNTFNNSAVARGKRRQVGGVHKPVLIKPTDDEASTSKPIKGMQYNSTQFRWEGNEKALTLFEAPDPPKNSSPENPRPALITNISATQGVQMVGGMVFDPQRMCWLKVASSSNPLSPSVEEEEDPFAGLDDLVDRKGSSGNDGNGHGTSNEKEGKAGGLADEWLVGEEFDVGPEFVRRQREEEERWRSLVDPWVGKGSGAVEDAAKAGKEQSKWIIRDLCGRK